MSTLWGGRFEDAPAPEVLAYTQSISFDHRLVREDCAVLVAHVRALTRAGLLSDEESEAAVRALGAVAAEIADGSFAPDPSDEDIHSVVERALLAREPEVGPKVRAGLSRNDRVATVLRLWLLREGRALLGDLVAFIETLRSRADQTRDLLMPGYTHLQRAQPVTLGHHLLAHAFALARDAGRFVDALARTDRSPLGAGALAGSTLGLDAGQAARDLGFAGAMANSLDAVAARDFVAEVLAACAICAVDLSRIGEEIVLWTSQEFGFASLDDSYATGSSLMPQKKNPDVFELARGKAGRVIGDLTGLLATLKGLPLAYNRDLQEDKEPLFDAVDVVRGTLRLLTGALGALRFDADAMAAAAGDDLLLATDLAEELVRRGIPFRDAHEAVGGAVRQALASGRGLRDLDDAELVPSMPEAAGEIRAMLDAAGSVRRRGAPGPGSIDEQLAALAVELGAIKAAR